MLAYWYACRWLPVRVLSGQCHVTPHHDCWLHGKFLRVAAVVCGEQLMERKHYVKYCKLIITDRYWLASHFFAVDSSELPIWVVSCLSQVMGMEEKKKICARPQETYVGQGVRKTDTCARFCDNRSQ